MLRSVVLLVRLGILFGSTQAVACEPKETLSLRDDLPRAPFVGVGIVVGERYPDLEQRIRDGEGVGRHVFVDTRLVRIAPLETLAGAVDKAPLEVSVPCGAPFPALMERAVYGESRRIGAWVAPADHMESRIRAALQVGKQPLD